MTISQSISWTDVAREAVEHLNRIIALGTSSPPAWELPAARYLLGVFESEGIPAMILPPSSSTPPSRGAYTRPNLVAHIAGMGVDEPLLLLSHLDSAPRSLSEWEPEIACEGSVIRGSGALSGTHLAVAHAMAMILLMRSEAALRRTVRYSATSDGFSGRGEGLSTLSREYIEHISSDIAIGWGGLSWIGRNREQFSLLASAEKGALTLRLRSEGGGGRTGIRTGKDPVIQMARAIDRVNRLEFKPFPSPEAREMIRSIALLMPESQAMLFEDLQNPATCASAITTLESDREIDPGLKMLILASLRTMCSIVRFRADGPDGLNPRFAEAEVACMYPPGEDVEALGMKVLDALGGDGVYLAEKEILLPSESHVGPEIFTMARAAMQEIDPRANLIVGISPWPTGLGSLRKLGTTVVGWEPFVSAGSLSEGLALRGGCREKLEIAEFVQEIRAIHSFLVRSTR